MTSKPYGDPLTAVRLPAPMLAAARAHAHELGTTLSALIRDALADRLDNDGVNWPTASQPIEGQTTIDDVIA